MNGTSKQELKATVQTQFAMLSERDKEIDILRARVEELEGCVFRSSESLAAAKARLSDTERQSDEWEKKAHELEFEIGRRDGTIDALRARIRELEAAYKGADARACQAEDDSNRIAQSYFDASNEVIRLREALGACVIDCEFSLAPDVMAFARAALGVKP